MSLNFGLFLAPVFIELLSSLWKSKNEHTHTNTSLFNIFLLAQFFVIMELFKMIIDLQCSCADKFLPGV